jgi:type III secretion system low calcium response chaperone LcrH/SycD
MDASFEKLLGIDPESMKEFTKQMQAQLYKGILEMPLAGLTKREQEVLYIAAHGYYTQRRYRDATIIFLRLANENKAEPRYFKGIAACYQMQGDHANAASYYAYAYILNVKDPSPLCHIAQCLRALGHLEEAREAFQSFIDESETVPACRTLRNHAIEALSSMKAECEGAS